MTDAIQKAREAKAWNCDEWPEWLHAVVDKTCEVADRLDMSSEQAHAYAALAALDAEKETLSRKCATEGCGNQATIHFIRGDVGSHYCLSCYTKVQALVTPEARS